MTVRFDLISAKSICIELEVYLNILLTDKQLEIQDIRPICGKFNWFAEVVTSCWNYLRHYKSSYSIDEPVTGGSSLLDSPPVLIL